MKVGPCISACRGSSDQKPSKTRREATVAASAIVPPVNAFDNVIMSGTTTRPLAGEHRAGPPEAGEDLVEDEQAAVAVRRFAEADEHIALVEEHAASPLHERLDQDSGNALSRLPQGFRPVSPCSPCRVAGRR